MVSRWSHRIIGGTGALSFSSNSANCVINGTTLRAAAVGGCTIKATKAADINYNAASSVVVVILDDMIFGNGFE